MEIMCTFTLSIRHKTNFKNREMENYRILKKELAEIHNTKIDVERYERGDMVIWSKEDYEVAKSNLEFIQFLNQISIEDCQKKGVKFERIFKLVKHLTR